MAKYFTLKEFIESDTAKRKGIDNFPSFEIVNHLEELVTKILDPLRQAWGSAIIVTSGYRCTQLNTAVGGVPTSAHKLGYAADLKPANGKTEEFMYFAKNWAILNKIKFDQIIREKKGASLWLHIGLYGPGGCQRGQTFDIVK